MKIEEYCHQKDWVDIICQKTAGKQLTTEEIEMLETIPTKMAEFVSLPQNRVIIKQQMQEASQKKKNFIFLPLDSGYLKLVTEIELFGILQKDVHNFEVYVRKILDLPENDVRIHVHISLNYPLQAAYSVKLCWCSDTTSK